MAYKTASVDGLGEIKLLKRRGSKNLRLSVSAKGEIRVSLPYWTPYSVGITFAKSRADWLRKHLEAHHSLELKEGARIGKSHRLHFKKTTSPVVQGRLMANRIVISSALPVHHPKVQAKALQTAQAALRKESTYLFPQRLDYLAAKHGFGYSQLKIRKMTSRWGSCSSKQVITLSSFLIQLPWPLIDYVIVHELLHTRHMHHGLKFWEDFEKIIPNAKKLRKEVNQHKPGVAVLEEYLPLAKESILS